MIVAVICNARTINVAKILAKVVRMLISVAVEAVNRVMARTDAYNCSDHCRFYTKRFVFSFWGEIVLDIICGDDFGILT